MSEKHTKGSNLRRVGPEPPHLSIHSLSTDEIYIFIHLHTVIIKTNQGLEMRCISSPHLPSLPLLTWPDIFIGSLVGRLTLYKCECNNIYINIKIYQRLETCRVSSPAPCCATAAAVVVDAAVAAVVVMAVIMAVIVAVIVVVEVAVVIIILNKK